MVCDPRMKYALPVIEIAEKVDEVKYSTMFRISEHPSDTIDDLRPQQTIMCYGFLIV